MERDTQLQSQLKRLKLSGILDTLEMRLLECQQNQLDYKTFLSLLLQDELEARQARKVERLLQQARFGQQQTLEGFDLTVAPGINAPLIRELVTTLILLSAKSTSRAANIFTLSLITAMAANP